MSGEAFKIAKAEVSKLVPSPSRTSQKFQHVGWFEAALAFLGVKKEKIFDKKRDKLTDNMMRNILTHANPEWREQRSICARTLDPKDRWGGSRKLEQSDDVMERQSKMVGGLQRLEKHCENG